MKEKYKLARNQGLNWRALVIEDLETEIPLYVKHRMIDGVKFNRIWQDLDLKVREAIVEFGNEELQNKTYNSMMLLAKRTYFYLYRTYFGVGYAFLASIMNIANGVGGYEDYKTVDNELKFKGVYNHAVPLDTYAKDYKDLMEYQMDYLAKIDAKERYDSKVSMRNIAEMTLRWEKHEQDIQNLKDNNVNLVWIVPHANCSERCEPWQGKLYSLNKTYGVTADGVEYQPLEVATNRPYTTKARKTYNNGCISGFNCRHQLQPYKEGVKPAMIPASVVKREREINDKQREMERGIRYYRKLALNNKLENREVYLKARAKAIELNKRYIEYSRENNVPFYPSRVQLLITEKE